VSSFPKPIAITHVATNDPMLAVGLVGGELHGQRLLAIGPDGAWNVLDLAEANVDLRFDWKQMEWVDVSPWSFEDAEADPEDDRGEGVQGYVPDVDGAGDGDQGNDADHGPGDLDADQGGLE
jgi:hypothetical protein